MSTLRHTFEAETDARVDGQDGPQHALWRSVPPIGGRGRSYMWHHCFKSDLWHSKKGKHFCSKSNENLLYLFRSSKIDQFHKSDFEDE